MLTRRHLLAAGLGATASGCYGKFALLHKLHAWNGSFGNKFLSTVLFWVLIILPVYEICSLVDFFVFNLIEFWTGSNPFAEHVEADGTQTQLARVDAHTVRVTRVRDGQTVQAFELVMEGEGVGTVRSLDGQVLVRGAESAQGLALTVFGRERFVPAAELARLEAAPDKALAASAQLSPSLLASR